MIDEVVADLRGSTEGAALLYYNKVSTGFPIEETLVLTS